MHGCAQERMHIFVYVAMVCVSINVTVARASVQVHT